VTNKLREGVRRAVILSTPNLRLRSVSGLHPASFEALHGLSGVEVATLDLAAFDHLRFLQQQYPEWRSKFSHPRYKKLVELSATFHLLDIAPSHCYVDAAGGCFTFIGSLSARRKILHDRFVSARLRTALAGKNVEFLESPAESIPLPDGSVDRISCHHSFEHFQGDSDTGFILEVQRLLAPGGRACIVPIFLAQKYYEIVDSVRVPRFDPAAERLYDPTSPFPGGRFSGRFARVYDLEAFTRRVLQHIDRSRITVRVLEIRDGDKSLPEKSLPCHRTDPVIDFPYRVLVLDKN